MSNLTTRRDFLKSASLAGAGAILAPGIVSAQALAPASANSKVVIAVMGTNSRGMFLAEHFARLPNVDIGYICDVDSDVLARSIAGIEKITGKRPEGVRDIRKLLEKRDFDGLVVAAPDHWHTPAAIMALQAGKHVYIEKPCSHNPREGELLVDATAKYKRLVQMGSQRRSIGNIQNMIAQLHEGVIGRVYFAKGWYVNNRQSIGRGTRVAVPPNLDFDLWQGPAPRRPFQSNLVHYNWHWFWHWGTGEALNNGTHELDVIRWGLGVDYPTHVVSAGGRFHFQDDWETPDTQTITYNFPNNTAATWEGRSCNASPIEGSARGVVFYGDKGTLVYGGGDSYKVLDPDGKVVQEVVSKAKLEANNAVSPLANLDAVHLLNFVEAIRGNATLNAPILEGHKSTLLPQLGNIAYRTGRALNCDPRNGRILNDADAMRLWSRAYEKGWAVKV